MYLHVFDCISCCRAVAALLQSCCRGAAVLLQCCCSAAAPMLPHGHTSGIAPTRGLPLCLPLGLPPGITTVTWLGHWELQVGTATALGVCPPPPTLSMMIFLCFPSPLFGVSRRNFKKNAPTCCDFWPPNHHFGPAFLSAVNRRFVVPCTEEISLKVLIPSTFLQALVK